MTELFLNGVTLKDFRTFGDFDVEIVPAPGLTLLVGTNGLGKSSFFDALEWGLTGQVQRFRSYMGETADEGRYLTRRGAAPGAHAVGLRFHDGSEILRARDENPASDDVSRLLKANSWTADIEDIGTYLAFTHFLGQAAQQRFTSRDRNEQWTSLKGPSGIDRLDEVRNGLRGRATELAFRRRIKLESDAVAEALRQIDHWKDVTTRLARLKELAATSGILEHQVFTDRLTRLVTEVGTLAPEFSSSPISPVVDCLAGVFDTLEALRTRAATRKVTLDLMADIPAQYAVQAAAADPNGAAAVEAASALAAETLALQTAVQAVATAQTAHDTAQATATRLRTDIQTHERLKQDLEQVAAAESALALLRRDQGARSAQLTTLREEQTRLDTDIEAIDGRTARIAGLAAAASAAQNAVALATRLVELRAQAGASLTDHQAKEGLAVVARRRLAEIAAQKTRLEAALEVAKTAVAAARERASVVAAAVAEIASHLRHDDVDCPVCKSSFEPGLLKTLAEGSAEAGDAALAGAEGLVANHRAQIEALGDQATTAQAAVDLAETARVKAVADARQVEECAARLSGALPGIREDEPVLDAAAALARAQTDLETAQTAAADDAAAKAERVARHAAYAAQITALTQAQATDDQQLNELNARRTSGLERLTAAGHTASDGARLNANLAALQGQASNADDEVQTLAERLRIAREDEAATRARHEALAQTATRLASQGAAAAAERTALARRWRDGGLPDAPTAGALHAALAQLATLLEQVQRLDEERATLAAAHLAAVQSEDLRELTEMVIQLGGPGAADAPDLHEAALIARAEEARAALAQTNAAHTAVGAFADKLRDEARDFSIRFLSPLNGLIDDFNEALLSTPGESVRLSAAYHKDRTQFDMGLHYRDPLDDALYDTKLPPQVVLSEGQLAANGFSILCAASTAYPWSRWRSLLMDDPLQHNDIIHAAAFVDLMRNLVELQRYQLIMSSHDRAEAEFIRRKFDAAGLPCSVIALTAPSKAGVRYLPPEHNRHAEKILTALTAQSA